VTSTIIELATDDTVRLMVANNTGIANVIVRIAKWSIKALGG